MISGEFKFYSIIVTETCLFTFSLTVPQGNSILKSFCIHFVKLYFLDVTKDTTK